VNLSSQFRLSLTYPHLDPERSPNRIIPPTNCIGRRSVKGDKQRDRLFYSGQFNCAIAG